MPPMILQGRRARRARRASSERRTDNLLVPRCPGDWGLLRRPLLNTLPGVGNTNDGGVGCEQVWYLLGVKYIQ
jgi:hypothetical protein